MPACQPMLAMNNHRWNTQLLHAWIRYTTWRIMKCLRYWIHCGWQRPDSTSYLPGFSGLQRRSSAVLFNTSLLTSTVPSQWKQACIRPVPKIPTAQQVTDYRPISITPVLSRIVERTVVRRYIYPALLSVPIYVKMHVFFLNYEDILHQHMKYSTNSFRYITTEKEATYVINAN